MFLSECPVWTTTRKGNCFEMSISSKNRNVKDSKTYVLRVDGDRRWPGTRKGKFFQFFSLFLCWFVCWLLAISVSVQWRGVPMEGKLPAVAGTTPVWRLPVDAASTGNLQTAIPKSWWFRRHCRWRFVFYRGSTPQKEACNCKKSGHESTETERETLREKELEKKNVLVWVPGLTRH